MTFSLFFKNFVSDYFRGPHLESFGKLMKWLLEIAETNYIIINAY